MAKLYYVGKDMNANDLTHWKYIKREKVNGKWRYYYKDDATGRDTYIKKPTTANKINAAAGDAVSNARKKIVSKAKDVLGYDELERYKKAEQASKYANEKLKEQLEWEQYLNAKIESTPKVKAEADKAAAKYEAAKKDYMKTPLSKIENLAAKTAKGREAVKKFAQKTVASVKKAAEKGKEFLNVIKAFKQVHQVTKNTKPKTTTVKTKWGTFTKARRN